MIRKTREFLFGKKFWEVPFLSQYRTCLPNQILMEFSVFANKKESTIKEQHIQPLGVPNENNQRPDFRKSYIELKYNSLRKIFNGEMAKASGFAKMESALKEFYDNLPTLTPPEIIQVLEIISKSRTRPIISIQSLCDLLFTYKDWKYSLSECSILLNSLSKLTVRDQRIIGMVVECLKALDNFHSPKNASFILHCLGDLKFRDPELLKKLFRYVLSETHEVKTSIQCLKTASLLNYQNQEVDEFIKLLFSLKPIDFSESVDYVNFIWACMLLGKQERLTVDQIAAALSEDFVSNLLSNGANTSLKWKLLNINGAAKQMKTYNNKPLLENHPQYKLLSMILPNSRNSFMKSVLDTLNYVLPQSANLKPLVNTGAGFYLDFEFNDVSNGKTNDASEKPKIGLMLLNYNDLCSDGTMSGLSAFKSDMLKNLGYRVILIRHSEFKPTEPLSCKMEFLRNKIYFGGPLKPSTLQKNT